MRPETGFLPTALFKPMPAFPALSKNGRELPHSVRKAEKVFSSHDYSVSGETFDVWESGDGYRFTHPVPEDLSRYYDSSNYLSHHSDEGGLMAAAYRLLRAGNNRWKRALLQRYLQKATSAQQPFKLLDFGCGTGHFAGSCARKGWEVSGLEPDTDAARLAQKDGLFTVYPDFSALPALQTARGFDAITAWHVLEHVPEPEKTLKHFYEQLKPDGVAVIAVPNFKSFDARFYGPAWAGYDLPRHLHHFTPAFLNELAAGQGFRPLGLHRMLLDAFFVSLLSEQYAGHGALGSLRAVFTGLRSNLSALADARQSSAFAAVFQKV